MDLISGEVNLEDVKIKLKNAVENEETGILLRADKYINGDGLPVEDNNVYFQLTSGKFRKEFITIWELFDERELFHECMAALSKMASDIREKTPYDIIVSCTPTAKELVVYLHSAVEKVGPIKVRHFGDYPSLNFSYKEMVSFQNERVLIITDVIASGTLVKRLGELVNRLGGTIQAVLAVFDTQEIHKEVLGEPPLPVINVGSVNKDNKVLLYSMVHRPIHNYNEVPMDAKIRKIDLSVLPEIPIKENGSTLNMITDIDAINQFEASDAIDFGFFTSGPVGFTIALRIDRILSKQGDDIWSRIRPHIPNDSVIATGFSKEDLRFFDFVMESAKKEAITIESMLIMKRGESIAIPHLFCSNKKYHLKDKVVILLISTAISSFKLENMVSLLAAEQVGTIRAICLVNRMGYNTTRFVKTINKLLKRFNVEKNSKCKGREENEDTNFEFLPVFNVSDIPSDDLSTMHRVIDAKIDRYRSSGNSHPILNLFADQLAKEFDSRTVNDRRFEHGFLTPLSVNGKPGDGYLFKPKDGKHGPITVHSLEAMTWLITYRMVAHRSYDLLIERIKNENDTRALYHYFGLLISDHNLSRLRRRVDRVDRFIGLILERIYSIRNERIRWEKDRDETITDEYLENEIRKAIDREVALISGLMLLADFGESKLFDRDFFSNLLLIGLSPKDWLALPVNLRCHFTDERLVCLFSMIISTFHPDLRESYVQKELKDYIYAKSRNLILAFNEIQKNERYGKEETKRKALFQKVKTFIDLIHQEIGIYRQREKHQVIRYFFRWILKWRDRHNPLLMDLNKALNDFGTLFDLREKIPEYTRKSIASKEMLRRIDEAIDAANILIELGGLMRHLYMFTPSTRKIHKRYMAEEHTSGYSNDALNIREILLNSKNRKSISWGEKKRLEELRTKIRHDFYDSTSAFRQSLLYYIVDFVKELRRNLIYSSDRLRSLFMGEVWINEVMRIDRYFLRSGKYKYNDFDWDVLVDPYLFQTTLRNVLYNIRHSFDSPNPQEPGIDSETGKEFCELVRIEVTKTMLNLVGEDSLKEFVQLDIMAKGKPFRPENLTSNATFASQREQIREYGGELIIRDSPKKGFTSQVTLQLLCRKHLFIDEYDQ